MDLTGKEAIYQKHCILNNVKDTNSSVSFIYYYLTYKLVNSLIANIPRD